MAKKVVQTYPIKEYLKTTDYRPEIKQMMMDLFKRQPSKSMADWTYADQKINKERCK